jgi:hypothetical protein
MLNFLEKTCSEMTEGIERGAVCEGCSNYLGGFMHLLESRNSFVFFILSSLAFALPAFATDEEVTAGLQEAQTLYQQRSATQLDSINKAIQILEGLEGKAEDTDLAYDVLILESRAYYWKGNHTSDLDQKMELHLKGQAKADEAKGLDDSYAEGYYYAGLNLGRWGEAKGVLASLGRKNELIAYMNQTISHPTRQGQLGKTLDGYGASRVLGRLYFKLPTLFGGSYKESVKHLKEAYTQAKDLALNVVYYAETLSTGSSSEKALANQILDELLAQNRSTYNPNRTPETIEEFELAEKLKKEIR